jgi:hypothetical protein
VGTKIKDFSQVKKEKQQAKEQRKDDQGGWNLGGPPQLAPALSEGAKVPSDQKDSKGGFQKGGATAGKPNTASSNTFQKDGITFSKGRPQFKKSDHVGNKGDFPELGDEHKGGASQQQ